MKSRRTIVGAALTLTVLLSFCVCCVATPMPAVSIVKDAGCCESECAEASTTQAVAVVSAVKRIDDRPAATVHEHALLVSAPANAVSVVSALASGSRLFEPLTSIQLRI